MNLLHSPPAPYQPHIKSNNQTPEKKKKLSSCVNMATYNLNTKKSIPYQLEKIIKHTQSNMRHYPQV